MTGAGEFRRGWPVLLGSFIGIAAGVSSVWFYSLGLFLKPLQSSFIGREDRRHSGRSFRRLRRRSRLR